MCSLSKNDRLKVLELVTEIASAAAKNPNVDMMLEFQKELIESLYHTMATLVEQGEGHDEVEFVDFDDDEEQEEGNEKEKGEQLCRAMG